jgi:hypothetical protein
VADVAELCPEHAATNSETTTQQPNLMTANARIATSKRRNRPTGLYVAETTSGARPLASGEPLHLRHTGTAALQSAREEPAVGIARGARAIHEIQCPSAAAAGAADSWVWRTGSVCQFERCRASGWVTCETVSSIDLVVAGRARRRGIPLMRVVPGWFRFGSCAGRFDVAQSCL